MSKTNMLPRSDELMSACANAVATSRREGSSEWATACGVLSAIERVLGPKGGWEQCPADKVVGGGATVRCLFQKGHAEHSFDSPEMAQRATEREAARGEAAKYRYMVECATTTALGGIAQLGDAAAGPTVAALARIREQAGLDPKPVTYETETITIPKAALRAIQRAGR